MIHMSKLILIGEDHQSLNRSKIGPFVIERSRNQRTILLVEGPFPTVLERESIRRNQPVEPAGHLDLLLRHNDMFNLTAIPRIRAGYLSEHSFPNNINLIGIEPQVRYFMDSFYDYPPCMRILFLDNIKKLAHIVELVVSSPWQDSLEKQLLTLYLEKLTSWIKEATLLGTPPFGMHRLHLHRSKIHARAIGLALNASELVVAVVGAGHVPQIMGMLRERQPEAEVVLTDDFSNSPLPALSTFVRSNRSRLLPEAK